MCLVLNYPRRIAVHCCVVLLFDLSKLFARALIFFLSTHFVYSFVYGCVIFRSHLGYLYAFSSWYTQFSAFVLTEKKNTHTLAEYTWKTCDSWKCGNVAMWQCEHNRNNNTKKSGLQIVYSDFIVFITLFTCNAYTWCWICCCWLSFIANNTFIHVYLKKIDRTWANEPSVNESYTKVRNVYIYVYRSINIEKSQRKESHLRQILVAWHNKLHFSLSCYHYYYIESETYSLIWFGFAPFSHDTARRKNETEKFREWENRERERGWMRVDRRSRCLCINSVGVSLIRMSFAWRWLWLVCNFRCVYICQDGRISECNITSKQRSEERN